MRFLIPLRLGMAGKLALSLAALLLFATLIIGLLIYWNAEQVLKSGAEKQLDHVSDIVDLRLRNEIIDLREDIRFLATLPQLYRVAETSAQASNGESPRRFAESSSLIALEEVFTSFLEYRPQYFQARFISQRDNGREVVRVDRRNNQVIIIPEDSLQQKGAREYFKEAMLVPEESLYVSLVNLNREHGVVEEPQIPTIRAAIPLYGTSKEALGIVVLNMDFAYVMGRLEELVPDSMSLYLTNSRGDFLLHPDPDMTFGFDRGQPHRIQEAFPAAAPYLQTGREVGGIVYDKPEVLYLSRFPLNRGINADQLFLALSAPNEMIFSGVGRVQRNTIFVMLLFCFIAIGLAFVFAHFHTRPLRRIRREAEHLGKKGDPLEVHGLPIERADEIGVLARSFARMSKRLQAQMVELHQERNRAEKSSRLKTAFLSNMSHEIRTPLTVMVGFGDLLAQDLSGDQKRLAQEIVEGGRRLTDTLVSVLTLAELEAEGVNLNPMPLDLEPVVKEIAFLFRWEAQRKGLTLTVNIHPAAHGVRVLLDKGGLASVLQNLIGNAIKFTTVGGIVISVEQRHDYPSKPERHHQGDVLIHVEDSGVGIEKDYFASLFEPFSQESTGYTRAFEGSGLGLSIAKQLTEKMGGTISVTSTKGQGSRFTLRFPQHVAGKKPSLAKEGHSNSLLSSRPPSSKRLLVVEDNEETCHLIKQVLAKDYEIKLATNAADALNVIEGVSEEPAESFDAVLMDINLGDGPSGQDVMRRLRKHPSYARVPIAAVTAYSLPGDRERFLSEGFSAYLQKPFMPDELRAFVSTLFSRNTG